MVMPSPDVTSLRAGAEPTDPSTRW